MTRDIVYLVDDFTSLKTAEIEGFREPMPIGRPEEFVEGRDFQHFFDDGFLSVFGKHRDYFAEIEVDVVVHCCKVTGFPCVGV